MGMYAVHEQVDGTYKCVCVIQDGTERWDAPSLVEAKHSIVGAARVLNGTYIRPEQVAVFPYVPPTPNVVSDTDMALLSDIKRGAKIALDSYHHLHRYNLSQDECELIQAIREGRARVTWV